MWVLLSVLAVLVMFPFIIAVFTSFKTATEVFTSAPIAPPKSPTLENYQTALRLVPLSRYLLNSTLVSLLTMLGELTTATLAAFAFAHIDFPGRRILFFGFLAALMVPGEATVIPNYMTVQALGWIDTYAALVIPFLATVMGTFILRQFFLGIPRELYDAAVVDGCSRIRYLLAVVVPISRPIIASFGVYSFLRHWNQYFWPLLVTNKAEMRTVQIGIAMLRWEEAQAWNVIMAGVVIVVAPTLLLFLIAQRHLVRGLTAGAVKG